MNSPNRSGKTRLPERPRLRLPERPRLRALEGGRRRYQEVKSRIDGCAPDKILAKAAECAEEARKDFTPSERVAINDAIKGQIARHQGARTDSAKILAEVSVS